MTTGLSSLDSTVQKTNEWLAELTDQLRFDDKQDAYVSLRAVLHALRDRLPVELSAALAAQLPMLVRGMYYEGWRPGAVPERYRTDEEFIEAVCEQLHQRTDLHPRARDLIGETLKLLGRRLTVGEVEKVKHALPEAVRQLWPGAA